MGIGKGKISNSLCTATGGAHAGFGGRAGPHDPSDPTAVSICQMYSSMPYGTFDSFTVLEGSGGGRLSGTTETDSGPGGGIIWIQSGTLILNGATLASNGG
jgi:hypothetical protein